MTSVNVSPTPLPANATALITCRAADDRAVAGMTVTVTGGTLAGGAATASLTFAAAASATGSVEWTTPAPGAYQVTCTAVDGATPAASGSRSVAASVVAEAPVLIDSLSGPGGPVRVGSTARFTVAARDAAGGTLTYTWLASQGTMAANGAVADWTAPASGGSVTIGVIATNAAGQTASLSMPQDVVVALSQGRLGASLRAPRRLAVAPGGRLYAAGARGGLAMLSARGELMTNVALPDRAVAVAASDSEVFVAVAGGKILKVSPAGGRVTGELPLELGRGPVGMALDAQSGLLWIAERDASRVRAVRQSGTTVFELTRAGTAPLRHPADVALDPAAQLVWVLLEGADSGQLVHAFSTVDGSYVRSAVPVGGNAGQIHRGGGLAVDREGRVYASDFLNGNVQVVERSGAAAGKLGQFGTQPGQLRQPGGSVILQTGDLVVASGDNGRLERFGAGAGLPECPGDADCDGLPDDWETRNGLDPADPRDALADADGDGLTSAEEMALGTDPRRRDTDGDGLADGEDPEPLVGVSQVQLTASAPASQGPGLVRISSVVENGTGCTAAWTQVGGPEVKLRKATSLSPSYVARQAGSYKIQGVATCNGVSSQPAVVETAIENLAPRADAGRLQVVRSGGQLELDGSFSSDANGDALTLAWEQVLGKAAAAGKHRGALRLEGRGGLLGFELTATDPAGLAAEAQAPVLVLGRSGFAPVAAVESPVVGKVGAAVALDARESILGGRSARFEWVQLAGPAVELREKQGARATFVPALAGHYAFAVSVVKRERRSPPARVDVYVASGAALPKAVAKLAGTPALGEPLTLDGAASQTGSGGALTYRWRQVAGPAAGLTEADQAVATVVPFAPGYHAFELSALEGQDESKPALLTFTVSPKGAGAPLAVARASAGKEGGDRGRDHQHWGLGKGVRLDGSASKNAVRWRWTQVGGPWVALDGGGAVATFVPRRPGTYAFELEVDDGSARSAPARVTVTVPGDSHDGDGDDDHDDDRDDEDRDDDREGK